MIVPIQSAETFTAEDEKIDHNTGEPKKPGRFRVVKLLVLFAFLVAAGVGAKQLWDYLDSYESTDDAQIEGHLNGIS